MLAPWPCTNNTIRGKVLASLEFELWWVLWVHVYACLVCAPKVLWLCTNQLIIWFVQVHVNKLNRLSFVLVPSKSSNTSLYLRSVANQGMCPNSFFFICLRLWTRNWVHQKAWWCVKLHWWRFWSSTPMYHKTVRWLSVPLLPVLQGDYAWKHKCY